MSPKSNVAGPGVSLILALLFLSTGKMPPVEAMRFGPAKV